MSYSEITIEEIIEFFEQDFYSGSSWGFGDWKGAAAVVRAQHEEIESLKTILREAEHLAGSEKGNLCARIIHMKDEIEGLRDIAGNRGDVIGMMEKEIAKVKQERDEAYERAAKTCEVEAIDLEYSEHPAVDFPYNQAVKDCAMAIRALKSGEPK